MTISRLNVETPIGTMHFEEKDGALCALRFFAAPSESPTPLLQRASAQLCEYFAGKRKYFDLPCKVEGSEFQKRVWAELCRIPYGETASYGEIARRIGSPRAARAVGMANNRNPLPILVPCHRVIGADGRFVGYAGGLDKKEYLLKLEYKNG